MNHFISKVAYVVPRCQIITPSTTLPGLVILSKGVSMLASSHNFLCPRHKRSLRSIVLLLVLILTNLAAAFSPARAASGPLSATESTVGRSAESVRAAPAADDLPPLVTIPPGGYAEIAVYGFCLNYQLPFPGDTLLPIGLAPDPVRLAIAYSAANGYMNSYLYQAQAAVWHYTDGDRAPQGGPITAQIIGYVESGATLPDDALPSASLVDMLTSGAVEARVVNFHNISYPAYFGAGTMVITNLTTEPLTLHFPSRAALGQ
jgi:hypothetical protein